MSIGIIIAILGLGLIIFIHELGHFIAGKLLRLKVTEFYLGLPFGRPIFRVKRGETEYGIRPVLFGGYVKFPEYIALNGAEVERVIKDGPAELAGIKQGDTILKIGNQLIETWHQIFDETSTRPNETVTMLVKRDDAELELSVRLGLQDGRGRFGAGPAATDEIAIDDLPDTLDGQSLPRKTLVVAAGPLMNIILAVMLLAIALMIGFAEPTNTVARVMPDSPAEKAGIRSGDTVIKVDGDKTPEWAGVIKAINRNPGEQITVVVKRDSKRLTVAPTLRAKSDEGLLGISTKLERRPRPVGEAITESARFSYQATGLILGIMGKLVVNPTSVVGQLRSPIGVVQQTAPIAQRDLLEYTVTLAGISIAIGIFNFLPIPPLDGGRIFISGVEFVTRRRIKKESLLVVNAVGISLLLALMAYVIVADIFRLAVTQ